MKNKLWTVLLVILLAVLLTAMLVLVPSGRVIAEIIEIPLDSTSIPAPREDGYTGEYDYEDPSVSVHIEEGRYLETNYKVAFVKIANATQLRAEMAGRYSSEETKHPVRMAEKVNAVLAVNGDYFSADKAEKFMCRQGKLYHSGCDHRYDVLVIDEQGDFHIYLKPRWTWKKENVLDENALGYMPVQGYAFGPAFVVDGVRIENKDFTTQNCGPDKKTQRSAICQTGPLEYLCICCEGPEDPGSQGLTIYEFADLVCSYDGILQAYNLDGGASTNMIFRGRKINSPLNEKQRPITDILYFCSAYIPDGEE